MLNQWLRVWAISRKMLLGGVTVLALSQAVPAEAATQAENNRAAEKMVREALHREIYGLDDERAELLEKAAELSPDLEAAMWHRGFIRVGKEWQPVNDAAKQLTEDARFQQYQEIRGNYPETVAGQLALANWCQKRRLVDQERAHLTNVLTFEPANLEARRRLGFVAVDGEWMSVNEIRTVLEKRRADQEHIADWRPQIERLIKGFRSRGEAVRTATFDKLSEITDTEAVPALELMLSNESEEVAKAVAKTIGAMPGNDASAALARMAIVSPWPAVRQAAAVELKPREKESYVPAMLALLQTPVLSSVQVARGAGGQLLYRHSFYREGQQSRDLMVLDTEYNRRKVVGGDREESMRRAIEAARENAMNRERTIAEENRRTTEINNRTCDALATATDEQFAAQPEAWWDWWNQHNGIFVQGPKQLRAQRQSTQVAIVDQLSPAAQAIANGAQIPLDCLAKGTKISAVTGLVNIDEVKVGDMVLTQNTDTGELGYKPVLRSTVRPASQLVMVHTDKDKFECSGGHPFWVSGDGWVKARDLKAGMELHTYDGSVRISFVEETKIDVTYNIIVADFNTYFVGEAKAMSHDNSIRGASETIVPGLKAE